MLIDIDPVEADYDLIVEAALVVRTVLNDLGLKGYAKTTGGDGMHIYVPLEPIYTYAQVRSFCEIVAQLTLHKQPDLFTTPRSVDKRKKGRVYFDYLQIGTGKTISSPYVVRAYDGAPVATPLAWKEVVRGLRPHDFRIDNTLERFRRVGDLFAPVLKGGQTIDRALERIQGETKKAAH
jgi:bifunctional non-homologous end joining protein LigD